MQDRHKSVKSVSIWYIQVDNWYLLNSAMLGLSQITHFLWLKLMLLLSLKIIEIFTQYSFVRKDFANREYIN